MRGEEQLAGTSRGNTAPTSLDKLIASVSGQIASDARLPEADLRERLSRLAERFVRIHDLVPISDAVLLEVGAYLFKYAAEELGIDLDKCHRVFGDSIWLEYYSRGMFLESLFAPGAWPHTRTSLIPELDRLHSMAHENTQALISFGFPIQKPSVPFDSYIDVQALYFTKLPLRVTERGGRLRYAWSKQAPEIVAEDAADGEFQFLAHNWGFARRPDGGLVTRQGQRVRECPYDEAALLPVLSEEEARRVERLRPAVLDMKLRLTKQLSVALASSSTKSAWDACLDIMVDCLTGQDVEFLLSIDCKYGFDDIEGHYSIEGERLPDPGGVSSLMRLIELCEMTMAIGIFDEPHRLLRRHVDCSARDRWTFQHRQTGEWMCEFDYPAVREAYGAFQKGLLASYQFIDSFRERVRVSVNEEFRDAGPLGILIARKLQPEFENRLRKWGKAFASLEVLPPKPEDVLITGMHLAGRRSIEPGAVSSARRPGTTSGAVEDDACPAGITPDASEVRLTPIQEKEFRAHGFKSRLPLRLTDERKGQSYVVHIGGMRLLLDPIHFLLVLRLATQLFRDLDGVDKKELRKGGFLPHDIEPAINNVRKALRPALGSLEQSKFLEAHERGKIRLSTHPACIAVEVEALTAGKDGRIAALAKEISTLAAAKKPRPAKKTRR